MRLRGFVIGLTVGGRFGCPTFPAEKNDDACVHDFFFVDSLLDGCLRFGFLVTVSHELTRSGNSTGSSVVFDCGIYQLFVDAWDRRILTFNFGSIELEFDDDGEEAADSVVGGMTGAFSFFGTSICKGSFSVTSIAGGTGCFNSRIRFRIAL